MKQYRVTRKFLDGILKGLTYTEITDIPFVLGKTYEECITGNHYIITEVQEV